MESIRQDAQKIMEAALLSAMPDQAVKKALRQIRFRPGKRILIAVGKAGWEMAKAAWEALDGRVDEGAVITKYGHARGSIGSLRIFEAGHPVPDEKGYAATEKVLQMTEGLKDADNVLFLLSGGGSALFEKPLISPEEMASVTQQLLRSGADITEINTVRKRLSSVKGGRFAQHCAPARVFGVVLSDVIGDPLDQIGSGPAAPDPSTCADAERICEKYGLCLSGTAAALIRTETPKTLSNASSSVTGSVRQLCLSAEKTCRALGYDPVILTSSLNCEAREAGAFLSAIAREHQDTKTPLAFLAGGETVVHVTGGGLGGRNQEIALAAAEGIRHCRETCVFSFGSDGTDGPTDAAGGYADAHTAFALEKAGRSVSEALKDNDAYHALQACGGLLVTGPTGTNVNDLSVLLIKR